MINLLREQLTPDFIPQPELIGLSSPFEKGDMRLPLYLYQIRESEQRNTQMINNGDSSLKYPPLTLNLDFLLTAHSPAHLQERALDESRILGKAMQTMYDHSIIRGSLLKGSLSENNEEIRVHYNNLSSEEMSKIWNFPSTPYKLSLSYSIGPVQLDSERTREVKRVTKKQITVQG